MKPMVGIENLKRKDSKNEKNDYLEKNMQP